jgi:hypothetical protein
MSACAWDERSKPWKVSPYFRQKLPSVPHVPNCYVHGLEELAARGRKERIQGEMGFPVPYPSKVILEPRPVEVSIDDTDPDTVGKPGHPPGNPGLNNRRMHHQTHRSIRAVCQFYVDFPYDRDLPLEVQGCDGSTFNEVFVRLGTGGDELIGSQRILYGEVKFKAQPNFDSDVIVLELMSTVLAPDDRECNRRVKIDMTGWGKPYKRYLRQQIAEMLDKAEDAHREIKKKKSENPRYSGKPPRPWIFFVGTESVFNQIDFDGGSAPSIAFIFCKMPKDTYRAFRRPRHEPRPPRGVQPPMPPRRPAEPQPIIVPQPPALPQQPAVARANNAPARQPAAAPPANNAPTQPVRAPAPPAIPNPPARPVDDHQDEPSRWVRVRKKIARFFGLG